MSHVPRIRREAGNDTTPVQQLWRHRPDGTSTGWLRFRRTLSGLSRPRHRRRRTVPHLSRRGRNLSDPHDQRPYPRRNQGRPTDPTGRQGWRRTTRWTGWRPARHRARSASPRVRSPRQSPDADAAHYVPRSCAGCDDLGTDPRRRRGLAEDPGRDSQRTHLPSPRPGHHPPRRQARRPPRHRRGRRPATRRR